MRAPFFVTAAAGTADLLAAELVALGIEGAREVQGGVACEGDLAAAYRACLESRLALRVLWQIARFPIADAQALYNGVREIDWSSHMGSSDTLIVDFSGAVPGVTHTQFGAQRVKDAVVDQFRERTGERPSVDRESPDAANQCPRRPWRGHDRHRPLRRQPAPARLSRRAGCGTAQGKPRRGDPDPLGLAGDRRGRRLVRRPDVRLRHARRSRPR